MAPCFPWFLSFGNRTQNSRVCGGWCKPNHQSAYPTGQFRAGFINENTILAHCTCAAGFEPGTEGWRDALNLCRTCLLNTYTQMEGDTVCTACSPTFVTATRGITKKSACVCAPGYVCEKETEQCTICPPSTHTSGFNLNTTCQGCPPNSINTLPGGTGANDCSRVLICSANWLEGAETFG